MPAVCAIMLITQACQLHQSFFGPIHSWRETFLEESFALQMHLNMSYSEVRKLPTRYRRWFLDRLVRHFKERNKSVEKSRKGETNSLGDESSSNVDAFNKYQEMLDKKFN